MTLSWLGARQTTGHSSGRYILSTGENFSSLLFRSVLLEGLCIFLIFAVCGVHRKGMVYFLSFSFFLILLIIYALQNNQLIRLWV
jgi:hypothetical protein